MRDMGAFESRQNSHKEFSHVRNWLSCYSYDSLYVEFDYRGKAIWKWGIFPLLSESFLIVHFFLSKSFLQGGGKLSVSKWEATVSGPQDMGYIWFHLWGYSESAKKMEIFRSLLSTIWQCIVLTPTWSYCSPFLVADCYTACCDCSSALL